MGITKYASSTKTYETDTLIVTARSDGPVRNPHAPGLRGHKDDPVKIFAEDFGRKAAANQLDSVRLLYPGAAKADSLSLTFNADSIKIEETATPGTFVVTYSPLASMTIKRSEQDSITVVDTKGLFAYPKARIDSARKTGQYADSLPDSELAARMNDSLFVEFLAKNFQRELSKNVRATSMRNQGTPMYGNEFVTAAARVSNSLSKQIDGRDYIYVYIREYPHNMIEEAESEGGKNIPAGGSARYETWAQGNVWVKGGRIKWKLSPKQLYEKYFVPTGKEWDAYAASKKK